MALVDSLSPDALSIILVAASVPRLLGNSMTSWAMMCCLVAVLAVLPKPIQVLPPGMVSVLSTWLSKGLTPLFKIELSTAQPSTMQQQRGKLEPSGSF